MKKGERDALIAYFGTGIIMLIIGFAYIWIKYP